MVIISFILITLMSDTVVIICKEKLDACHFKGLTSVSIFSIMFTIRFLRCCLGDLVEQSKASLVSGQFLYFCEIIV